jgi:YaiO family outer membrane protein
MNRYLILFVAGLFITGLFINGPVFSQDITNPESEYQRIREIAFGGDYKTAAAAARKLVNAFPTYGDARILLGRILAWQKDFKQAAAVIDTLLAAEPDNADALSARRDISLWSKDNTPVATDIRAGYSFDNFTKPYTRFWQVFKAGAGHRFNWGPATAGLNLGAINKNDTLVTEFQLEGEAWPKLSDKNYAYLSYAFSPGKYFPGHRGAIEVWQVLPEGWAVSAGMTYYRFDRNIFISVVSVEKYINRFWLNLRGFLYFKDDGIRPALYFNGRRYFNDTDYLQLTLGTGTAPDEPIDIKTDIERYSANSIRLSYNGSVTKKLSIRIGAGYSYEEFAESEWRNRFEGHINFIYAIKMK